MITNEELEKAVHDKEQTIYPNPNWNKNTPDTWIQGYYEAYEEVFRVINNTKTEGAMFRQHIKDIIFDAIGASEEFKKAVDKEVE